jgi:hypothetical protein
MAFWKIFLLLAFIFCLFIASSTIMIIFKINATMLLGASLTGFLIAFIISFILFIKKN